MNKILLKDKSTNTILQKFDLDQVELAYSSAIAYEKHDLNIEVIHPSSVEQLGNALGASNKAMYKLKCDMLEELDSHQ